MNLRDDLFFNKKDLMLKRRLMHIVPAVAVLLAALTSCRTQESAKGNEYGGPPTKEQIVGIWKLVDGIDLGDILPEGHPWAHPYQYYAFYEDGRFNSMTSTYDTESTLESLEEAFSVLPAERSPKYNYKTPFLTISYPDVPDGTELWGMNLFVKDMGEKIKKGDLVMSMDDGVRELVYMRVLRRME